MRENLNSWRQDFFWDEALARMTEAGKTWNNRINICQSNGNRMIIANRLEYKSRLLRLQLGSGWDHCRFGWHVRISWPSSSYPWSHVNLTVWPTRNPSNSRAAKFTWPGSWQFCAEGSQKERMTLLDNWPSSTQTEGNSHKKLPQIGIGQVLWRLSKNSKAPLKPNSECCVR